MNDVQTMFASATKERTDIMADKVDKFGGDHAKLKVRDYFRRIAAAVTSEYTQGKPEMCEPSITSTLEQWIGWIINYNNPHEWREENLRYSVRHALELYAAGCVGRALDRQGARDPSCICCGEKRPRY